MTGSFYQLFLMNLRLVYRNRGGLFFTLVMPTVIFVALSILPIGRVLGETISYSDYLLPGIIAMTVMQGGIYGLAYWMVDMKSRGVIKRFLVTPIKQPELIISLLASRALVSVAQAVFLTLVATIFFGFVPSLQLLPAIVVILLGAGIFLMVGLLISMIADSYEAAAPVTAAIGLPLTFLGNIFFPVSSLPGFLEKVANILPITYMADALRILFLRQDNIMDIWKDLLILLAWFIAILVLVLWKFRLKE